MKLVYLLFLGTSLVSLSSACGILETKRTCECTAVYTMGGGLEKRLFSVPSMIDCVPNLGCEQYQFKNCSDFCLKSINLSLGGKQSELTTEGSDKVCQLVARPGESVTAENRIRVMASWDYIGCKAPEAKGRDIVVDNLCCNQKCECLISAEKVSSAFNFKELANLSNTISNDISFDCSKNELEECRLKCLDALRVVLPAASIDTNPTRLNWNLFAGNDDSSRRICELWQGEEISRPGMDVYLEVDDKLATPLSRLIFSLGRVCCRQKCKCEWYFEVAENKERVGITLIDPVPNLELNLGYDCSREIDRCMTLCRRQSISPINKIDSTTATFQQNDFFNNQDCDFNIDMCIKINRINRISDAGFNVYVRHTSSKGLVTQQDVEDMHFGRICCLQGPQSPIPVNRCDQLIPNPIC